MKKTIIILIFILGLTVFVCGKSQYRIITINSTSDNTQIQYPDSISFNIQTPKNTEFRFNEDTTWKKTSKKYIQITAKVPSKHILFIRQKDGTIKKETILFLTKNIPLISFWVFAFLTLLSIIWTIVRYFKYRFSIEISDLELRLQNTTDRMIEQRQTYETKLTERLPKEETENLKAYGKSKRYKMVTVLFSDVSGFSKLTSKENPDKLVDDLDKFFFHFDQTVKKYNIQKIKTVGDTYMCAGGIPKKNRTNPIEVVLAAVEMQNYINKLKTKYPDTENRIWGLRIGIHTGPVFAGKDGFKKQSYDIWGETVNIASRMESSGEIGKINISGNTYELIRDYFLCNYHGRMPVKYRGDVDMYFIENFRPDLCNSKIEIGQNENFNTKLAFIRFDDLEEEIMDLLEKKLSKNLYYHNLKHTIDVVTQVELIGRQENISEHDMLMLKTAALFHDIGFTRGYKDHELLGIKIAKEILPRFHYKPEQIEIIADLIYVTKLPPKPKTKIEKIICDADLDYLGRADFIPVSENLFRELVEFNFIENDYNKWNQIQINFISSHQYFTDTAKRLRDVNKKIQLENIRKQLKN